MDASRLATAVTTILILTGVLAGCSGQSDESSSSAAPSPGASSSQQASESPTPSPSPTTTPIAIPDDCKAILSESVLAELDSIPLNDPAMAPTEPQSDAELLCVWGDPAADTTVLTTEISRINRGPALDMLNALVDDEGFSCFTPDDGTRCEKTWENETYPVTDGRTLFWREDVLIDTSYSNLAPSGYTSSIVAHLFD